MLARSLCRFRHFTKPTAAQGQYRAILRNQLLAWAPFDDSDFCVVLRGGSAMVWAWDAARVRLQLAAVGVTAPAALVPEALCSEPAARDGTVLVGALEGVEGQCWQRGDLVTSRWWPQVPEAEEWRRWCGSLPADCGAAEAELQPPISPKWRRRPWAEGVGHDALLSTSSPLERVAVGAALVGLAGISAALGHQALQVHGQRHALAAERDRLTASVAPALAARDRANSLAASATLLASQLSAVQPLEVLNHLAERLPTRGVLLRDFELTGSRLRIALDLTPDIARASIVKDLQADGWLVQVSEVRDAAARGGVQFEMGLDGLRPAAAAAPTTGVPPAGSNPPGPAR